MMSPFQWPAVHTTSPLQLGEHQKASLANCGELPRQSEVDIRSPPISCQAATPKTCTACRFSSLGEHMLRHTFCSLLAMRGATVIAIMELAGHRSIRTRCGTCT